MPPTLPRGDHEDEGVACGFATRRTRERQLATMMTSGVNPIEIHYEDVGRGSPIVFVHGWPLSLRMWESQVNALTAAGHRCISYDRRGFGESEKPASGYDYDTLASDLNDLMTHLDLRDAMLVGFSMGGGEVARYIAGFGAARVAKVALLGSVTPFLLAAQVTDGGIVDGSAFDAMRAAVRADRLSFLERFFVDFYNVEPGATESCADLLAFSKSMAWAAAPLATQECILSFGETDFRADLESIHVPTLIIHGDADRIVPLAASAFPTHALVRQSRLVVLKGAPHGFTATHAEELNALLVGFARPEAEQPVADRHAAVRHASPRRATSTPAIPVRQQGHGTQP